MMADQRPRGLAAGALRPLKQALKGFALSWGERLARGRGERVALERSRVRRVLVLAAGGIGDLLRVLPAIESLRHNFPEASLTVLASPAGREALCLFPRREIIDAVAEFDLRGRHRHLAGKCALAFQLRRAAYDLVYAPERGEGMRELTMLAYLTGAPHRIGFSFGTVGGLHTLHRPFQLSTPILQQNLALLRAAGLHVTTESINIAVPAQALAAVHRFLGNGAGSSAPGAVIAVHPAAAWRGAYRTWPAERFAALVRRLRRELRATVLILGDRHEHAVVAAIQAELHDPGVVVTAGQTTLAEMAALIQRSQAFVGNDSGPLHIALALGVPSVGIFGATAAEQVLSTRERCVVIQGSPADVPPYRHEPVAALRSAHAEALARIPVEAVFTGVQRALTLGAAPSGDGEPAARAGAGGAR